MSKFVELDGRKLLDGGCTDSVPVEAFRRLGYKRNVVVLTRDSEYRKKPENAWMADIVYHKYPKFAEALKNRAVEYNMSIRNIEKLERAGEVFVICPSVPLTIPRICKSAEEIEKTRRRVNALEYVKIPEMQANIKYITMKLDENDRSTTTRLMKVKDMLLKDAIEAKRAENARAMEAFSKSREAAAET